MTQFYLDPSRESEAHALPDAEVFYQERPESGPHEDEQLEPGWYWWACLPGCLPEGEPSGPFDSEALAIADAQEAASDDEEPETIVTNVCADGGFLCLSCTESEAERIADVDPQCPDDDQWRIIGQQEAESADRCDHCGHLIRTPITPEPAHPCDQCKAAMINGVACHETGCPNSHLHPATGLPYPDDADTDARKGGEE